MIDMHTYGYSVPKELIAETPAQPRDTSRLFVYNTKTDTVVYDHFYNIHTYLPERSLVVLNDTKVVPARLSGTRASGEPIEVFVLYNEGVTPEGYITVLTGGSVKVGEVLSIGDYTCEVIKNTEKRIFLKPLSGIGSIRDMLHTYGTTPIPPYIKKTSLSEEELRTTYQTIFAQTENSVAAPTASLHITERVLTSLASRHIGSAYINLGVGLGTFSPVLPEHIRDKKLHHEPYSIGDAVAKSIQSCKMSGRPIVAVGTTVVRALESARESLLQGKGASGDADIFIYPPYTFAIPDILVTNFHVPQSSLMCLVDAFLKHKGAKRTIVELYADAIENKYRLFSFGDAMLVI